MELSALAKPPPNIDLASGILLLFVVWSYAWAIWLWRKPCVRLWPKWFSQKCLPNIVSAIFVCIYLNCMYIYVDDEMSHDESWFSVRVDFHDDLKPCSTWRKGCYGNGKVEIESHKCTGITFERKIVNIELVCRLVWWYGLCFCVCPFHIERGRSHHVWESDSAAIVRRCSAKGMVNCSTLLYETFCRNFLHSLWRKTHKCRNNNVNKATIAVPPIRLDPSAFSLRDEKLFVETITGIWGYVFGPPMGRGQLFFGDDLKVAYFTVSTNFSCVYICFNNA